MITAVLATAVIWCLFYGQLALFILIPLCVGIGVALAVLGRHDHSGFLIIDTLAQTSKLKSVNPTLKFLVTLIVMVICVASGNPMVGLLVAFAMGALTTLVGGIKLHTYVHMLSLPAAFLMISGIVLLFDIAPESIGVINIPLFGMWLCVTPQTQALAGLVMGRAFGAVSCLYFLSLTTPLSEIIGILRRFRCPSVLIDLMYLIYRYIFILLSMYRAMSDSAKSRMGFDGLKASLRSTGSLYSNLLARSYRQANQNFDAMESRCYDSDIRFLERRPPATVAHIAAAAGLTLVALALVLFLG